MTRASVNKLSELHGKVANALLSAIDSGDRATTLLDEFKDELPDAVREFLEDCSTASPALLTVAARFLKDNSITAVVEDSDQLSELQQMLQQKKERRKRVGNVVPIEE